MKKIIAALLTVVIAVSSMLALSSCGDPIDGINGKNGQDGKNGLTPYIGENGNWWLGDTDTGKTAVGIKGDKGDDGDPGAVGENGENGENGKDSENPLFRYNVKTERLEASYDDGETWEVFPIYPFVENEKDDSDDGDYVVKSYEYPMSSIQILDGCIATIDNRYVEVNDYYGAIIDLKNLDYDQVTFAPSKTMGEVRYAFLSAALVVDRAPTYCQGYYEVVYKSTSVPITVDIPEEAKYIYVYYLSVESNTEYNYLPTSIVFSNK